MAKARRREDAAAHRCEDAAAHLALALTVMGGPSTVVHLIMHVAAAVTMVTLTMLKPLAMVAH